MDKLDELLTLFLKEASTYSVKSFYDGLHVISDAANEWHRSGGGRGWAEAVTTPTGEQAFPTKEEQDIVEEFFNGAEDNGDGVQGEEDKNNDINQSGGMGDKNNDINQSGGMGDKNNDINQSGGMGDKTPIDKTPIDKTLIELAKEHIDPQKISLDLAYRRTTDYMDSMDATMKDLARQIGIIKFQDSIPPIPLEPFGIPYELSARTIIPLVTGLVELIRVFATFGPGSADFMRVPLSFMSAMIDLGRGDWKKAVLSMFGVLGRFPAALGIFLKLVRDLFLFVSPDLSTEMRDLFYKSTKSFFAGVMFWSFSTFAPEPLFLLVKGSFDQISDIIRTLNEKVDQAEETMLSQLPETVKKCYNIKFRRIPEGIIPEFDNLEALQAAFAAPEIYCNPVIRKQIDKLTFIPPVRLMLELLNIPTLPEDFEERCAGVVGSDASMEDAIINAMKPIVILRPECASQKDTL
jgi:hypothetical protein